MKSLKERMQKIDKICQKLNIPDQNKGLFKRKKNNSCIMKEQDKNINNVSMISSNAGCIISRTQLKKQQSIQMLQCDTVRSQTLSLKQLKMIHEQDQIQCMQSQKEELQNQINQLVQMKKQIQEQEEKKKKQFITQDTSLLPQMLKLQQEKLSIENEINQIDSKIEQVRYSNINKLQVLQKRNWKEEKKSFEQKWLDLEQNESKIQIDDKLYNLFIHDSPPQEQVDQKTIDTLTKEVEDLLCLKLPDEQEDQQVEQSQRSKLNQNYQSPLYIIEEEQSVELSFQKL
ncbi:unnamed protein product [Paramecium octaurelia]|uniref:Uncharacterized protein n=1 Tax=Paramecium octaurelia TaxID=43137 RepID=A0A8S1TXT5_PAROT|nr:unnamed protein product [Paramecium octaurelia]CAD8157119.1 unnamed protein product [Paramecium octaurelia]